MLCLCTALFAAAESRAEPDAARAVADLRERGEFRQAEQLGMERWRQTDLSDGKRSDLAIQLALVYSEQALAAPPESRSVLWMKADEICDRLINGWPDNPRRVLVEVQWALVSLARGEQARQSHDEAQAIEHLRAATRRFSDITKAVGRELMELRLRPQGYRSADALSVGELESLAANVLFQLARSHRQLGLCYPPDSTDRDDALLQAVERLKPLAQQSSPDALTWKARVELAAALRELGQTESAQQLAAVWQRESPPDDVANHLAAEPHTPAPRANISGDRTQNDDAFVAAMAAAAAEREAGRHAAAAEQYRRLSLRYPNHGRASAAHRAAILYMAVVLRESEPGDRAALVTSYEQLLREHLTRWPTHASADEIRLWLGQLLVGRRDWADAVEVLQSVDPTSAHFSESVHLLVRCYEAQLRRIEGHGEAAEQQRAQLLAAATGYLQPIITGPDNRWPDSWSKLQRESAVALARLHLRFSEKPSPYAERLLTAALSGTPAIAESEDSQARAAAARLVLVEALARNGKVAEARAALEQLENVSIESLRQTMTGIDGLLADDSQSAADNRELGELALSIVRLIEARRSELDAAAMRRLDAWRAAALAAAGDRAAALAHYAALATQWPDDGTIQERYAALLADSDSSAELRQALARWQEVESRSRRGGPRWRRARKARIDLLTQLGDRNEAEKLSRLTRLLYPDWDAAPN
jgi:hypothetical protein